MEFKLNMDAQDTIIKQQKHNVKLLNRIWFNEDVIKHLVLLIIVMFGVIILLI